MFEFITNPGGGQVILVPHLLIFYYAYRKWLNYKIVWSFGSIVFDIIGLFCTIVAFFSSLTMLFDVQKGGIGSFGSAYLIYAAVTLGIFVVLTHMVFYLSGRFVGRAGQLLRLRKLKKNLGRPEVAV